MTPLQALVMFARGAHAHMDTAAAIAVGGGPDRWRLASSAKGEAIRYWVEAIAALVSWAKGGRS